MKPTEAKAAIIAGLAGIAEFSAYLPVISADGVSDLIMAMEKALDDDGFFIAVSPLTKSTPLAAAKIPGATMKECEFIVIVGNRGTAVPISFEAADEYLTKAFNNGSAFQYIDLRDGEDMTDTFGFPAFGYTVTAQCIV